MDRGSDLILFLAIVVGLSTGTHADEANQLTKEEQEGGFELLFNGRDLSGWKSEGNWMIVDGALTCVRLGSNLACERVKIHQPFFELRFEWKLIKEGGALAKEAPQAGPPDGCFYTEYRVPRTESDSRANVVRRWGQMAHFYATGGGAVGLFGQERPLGPDAPVGLFTSSGPTKRVSRPVGQWNSSRIVWIGETFQHWLNGEKVVEFQYRSYPQQPGALKRMTEQLKMLTAQALTDGLQLRLEVFDSPLLYRSIKFRRLREDAAGDSARERESKRGRPGGTVEKE